MAERQQQNVYQLDKVGTDVEIFLRDIQTGAPVPAIGLIGGTKYHPKPVPCLGKGFFVQEDNVMLEYNVPPAKIKKQFVDNIMAMNSWLQTLLLEKGLKADLCSSMRFSKEQLSHPQAQEIGCEPDWDVWTRLINPSPKENPLMREWRTSGGHIHVSFSVNGKKMKNRETDNVFLKEPIVKALDFTIGLPGLTRDIDPLRRMLYGKMGAFRNIDYGIEYRTESNHWTKSPQSIAWAFDGVEKAFFLVNQYPFLLEESYSLLKSCFSYALAGRASKFYEHASFLLSRFDMLDRAIGINRFDSEHARVVWPTAGEIK